MRSREWFGYKAALSLMLVSSITSTALGAGLPLTEACSGPFNAKKLTRADLRSLLIPHYAMMVQLPTQAYRASQAIEKMGLATEVAGARPSSVDLCGADMRNADLSGIYFGSLNLSAAKLFGANLANADIGGADLRNADLGGTDLTSTVAIFANFTRANLRGANLTNADLLGADMTGAFLDGATLHGADLTDVNFTGAALAGTNLANAQIAFANLTSTLFEPTAIPNKFYLGGLTGVDTVRFDKGKQGGLVQMRAALRDVGLRDLERGATFSIEHGKTRHANAFERWFRIVCFEWTTGYGLYPGRALMLLFCLVPLFAVPYAWALRLSSGADGLWREWLDSRMRKELGQDEPERLRVKWWQALGIGLYFSFLSAFHIGWRDFNVGSWLIRMQPREYVLRASGWTRTVSGLQSLLSVYLLAIWALTYFGRPFE